MIYVTILDAMYLPRQTRLMYVMIKIVLLFDFLTSSHLRLPYLGHLPQSRHIVRTVLDTQLPWRKLLESQLLVFPALCQ